MNHLYSVHVLKDGSLNVTETITVNAEGREIKRGIYRDFPIAYTSRFMADHANHTVSIFSITEHAGKQKVCPGLYGTSGITEYLPVICFDRHLPESIRTCVLRGAQIILIPTTNTSREPRKLFEWELRVAAMQKGVYIACCNRVGVEDAMEFYER